MKPDQATFSNKILLIDDDTFFRETTSYALSDFGYTVITAENGLAGIQQLRMHSDVDLVLVDIVMPIMDGFMFIENARKDFPDIPIVVISGIGTIEEAIAAIRAGAWDFITKPIESQELLRIVLDRNIEKYIAYKSSKEYQVFLENLAKMRSNQLEEALTREQEFKETVRHDITIYRNIFRKIPMPIALVEEKGRTILDANEAFLTNAGYTAAEVRGKTFDDICFNISFENNKIDSAAWLSGQLRQDEIVRCENGKGTWFEAKLTTVPFMHDGNLELIMAVLNTCVGEKKPEAQVQ